MRHNGPVTHPTTTAKRAKADPLLADAVEVAQDALVETVGEAGFGDHEGVVAEDDRVLTHFFAAAHPGYTGWHWAVTVTRAPRQKTVTVNEVVLLPGESALVAPPWLPWKDRVSAADLGPGDLIPVLDDDPRLVPGYLVGDEPLDSVNARDTREVIRELGLGRPRVLSAEGRRQAADRWYAGRNGPDDPIAKAAPAHCGSCGFLVRVSGPLGMLFGLCANESSPSDGQAVSFDHGCGAHSDVRLDIAQLQTAPPAPVHDTMTWDAFADGELEPLDR
jgi:Protein of unknown function (DUF3027)